ncbi:MAG TPA: RdgB/HAM1 family non-canonical purine NTP pyrophosphatase [Acholeplasmataceae bacterium]|nr:RdgB/HAM1 family non-canonical purine NTP pyrophosphatase [Acholeplasmataceae bacterium]
MDIIVATHNENKVKEIKKIVTNTNINLISLNDLGDHTEVEETGLSFAENAQIKAKYYFEKYHKPVFADDSGLVIPGFDNKPGIYSARYAGINATDLENNQKLLNDIKSLKDRKAYFVCHICYINQGKVYFFEGRLDGIIAYDIKGSEGFGYDPIFILANGKRLSEIPIEEKNKISHRAKAIQKWLAFIKDGGNND